MKTDKKHITYVVAHNLTNEEVKLYTRFSIIIFTDNKGDKYRLLASKPSWFTGPFCPTIGFFSRNKARHLKRIDNAFSPLTVYKVAEKNGQITEWIRKGA